MFMKSCPASLVSAIAFFGSSLPLWPQFGISFGFVESTAAGRAIGLNGGQESRHLLKFNDICLFMASYCQVSAQSRLLRGHFG